MMININFLQCNTTHKDKCMKMLTLPKVVCPCFFTFEKIFQLAEKYEKFKYLNYCHNMHK